MNKVRGNAVHCVTPIDLVSMADSQVDIAAAVACRYGKALNDRLVISTNDGKPQWRSKAQRLVVVGFGADPGKLSEKSSNSNSYRGVLANHSVKDFDEHVRQRSADKPSVAEAPDLIGFEANAAELAIGDPIHLIE